MQAITDMVQTCANTMLDSLSADTQAKMELLTTLKSVTDGKVSQERRE